MSLSIQRYVDFAESTNGVYRDGAEIPFREKVIHRDAGSVDATLIIPNYNRAGTIEAALDSALACNQKQCSFEVMVVDDGSSDGSLEILKRRASSDSNVNLIALARNSGSEALPKNIAAFLARGKYLSYLDSDDRIGEPDAFGISLAAIEGRSDAVMTISNLLFEIHCTREEVAANMPWVLDVKPHQPSDDIRDHSALEYRRRIAVEHSVYELLNHGYYDAFKLMRRDAFLATGGVVEDLASCGDFGTYLRLNRIGRTVPVQRDFYIYRIHGGNDSFYSDEKRRWMEVQHRAFALDEIRFRRLQYKDLLTHCQAEFWERYQFTREEVKSESQ